MLEMLWPDIAHAIIDNKELPTSMANCFGRILRVKHHLAQMQEEKANVINVSEWHDKRKDNSLTSRITQFHAKRI